MKRTSSRLQRGDIDSIPYTKQQIQAAISRLSDPLNVLLLLDFLSQTDDPLTLISLGIMPRIRTLIEECLRLIECTIPKPQSETSGEEVIEKLCRASFGNYASNHDKISDPVTLLLHLYMLLEAILRYKNNDISSSYFSGVIPNDCITTLLSDPSVENKALTLRIVALLLENESTNPQMWCDTNFFIQLLHQTNTNPNRNRNIKKAIIDMMCTLVRRSLLTDTPNFIWLESLWRYEWTKFEELFPQETVDDDYYLTSCSFLEVLSFQVARDSDIKKKLQALNDRLKISKWNSSRREQKRILDVGKMGLKAVRDAENQVFTEYGEVSLQISNQEAKVTQLKNQLHEEYKLINHTKEKELHTRNIFLVGICFSAAVVATLFLVQRNQR